MGTHVFRVYTSFLTLGCKGSRPFMLYPNPVIYLKYMCHILTAYHILTGSLKTQKQEVAQQSSTKWALLLSVDRWVL